MLLLRKFAAVAALLAFTALPASAATTQTYHGHTTDERRVSFQVSRGAVRAFVFQTRFVCSNHRGFVARARFPKVRLSGHRFGGTFHNRGGSVRTVISGHMSGRRATGTIKRRATFNRARKLDPRGQLVCTSSTRFTARR